MAISPRMKRAINSIGIIIDDSENGFKGRITHRYPQESYEFKDLPELFQLIEEVLDDVNYPSLKIRKRYYKNTEEPAKRITISDTENIIVDTDKLLGDEQGFILMVNGRDNATMQGSVYDSRQDKTFKFNGDIELIRLINQ